MAPFPPVRHQTRAFWTDCNLLVSVRLRDVSVLAFIFPVVMCLSCSGISALALSSLSSLDFPVVLRFTCAFVRTLGAGVADERQGEQKKAVVYSCSTKGHRGRSGGAMEGWDDRRSPEIPKVVPNELFFSFLRLFFFLLRFTSIPRYLQTGFTRRPRQITQHGAAELVSHWTQETAADCDRLGRGGIVLIEMNIVLFPLLVFLMSAP